MIEHLGINPFGVFIAWDIREFLFNFLFNKGCKARVRLFAGLYSFSFYFPALLFFSVPVEAFHCDLEDFALNKGLIPKTVHHADLLSVDVLTVYTGIVVWGTSLSTPAKQTAPLGSGSGAGQPRAASGGNAGEASCRLPETGDGKKPPPERTPGSTKHDIDKDPLIAEMARVLQQLGKLAGIAREKKQVVILVMDIDETLIHDPQLFPEEHIPYYYEVQKQWFTQINDFLGTVKGTVFLIYNTANPFPEAGRFSRRREKYEVSLKNRMCNGGIKIYPLFDKECPLGIPDADILISAAGGHIELSDLTGSAFVGDLDDINSKLKMLSEKARSQVEMFKNTFSYLNRRVLANYHYARFFDEEGLLKQSGWEAFNGILTSWYYDTHPGFNTAIAPLIGGEGLESLYLVAATINKGTGLNIVMQSFIETLRRTHADFDSPLTYIFGDHIADMPMLRPDLEARAVGYLSEESIRVRDEAMSEFGLPALAATDVSWWTLSVVAPHSSLATQGCGDKVKSALKHDKVIRIQDWGVLAMLKELVSDLGRRLEGGESR